MISIDNYKLPDGRTNWEAYRAAKVANGELCRECGRYITFAKGYPSLCYECKSLQDDKGEVCHDNYIRCPYCKSLSEGYHEDLRGEGEHTVTCYECEKNFEVSVEYSVTYTSPALCETETEEEEEEDDTDEAET
jgi:hypothetical protein